MKRSLAQDVNRLASEQLGENNEHKVGVKLLAGESLTFADVAANGTDQARQLGYQPQQLIACKPSELRERLAETVRREADMPVFCLVETSHAAAVFCVDRQEPSAHVCLYVDLLGKPIPQHVTDALCRQFGQDVQFKIYRIKITPTANTNDNYMLSLSLLNTLMVHLKSDKRQEFINDFDNSKRPYFDQILNGVQNMKSKLISSAKECYYKNLASDITQLSMDTEFKKAIKEFVDLFPGREQDEHLTRYHRLLAQFAEMKQSELDNVDDAKVNELEEVRRMAFSTDKMSLAEQGARQMDIASKFPAQMKKFTKIFEPLTRSETDDNLDKKLKNISEKLDLDYDKIRSFFASRKSNKNPGHANDSNSTTANATNTKNLNENNTYPKCDVSPASAFSWVTTPIISFLLAIFQVFLTLIGWPLIHTPCMYTKIGVSAEKSFAQLLSEMEVDSSETVEYLRESYNKVKRKYEEWKSRTDLEISRWAAEKKGRLKENELCEALAVMDRANELATRGHRLRDAQLLCLLTFLRRREGSAGQLCQVRTGEGKTTIVSILAAAKALQGETVDVVTSNPVLAAEAIRDKGGFYELLGLSVATNNADERRKSGARACYKADVVYGTISNFQFDLLTDSFVGMNTRGGRPFDRIILDEVDSMIIDNASHTAKLATPFPGMDSLKYVYIKIWIELYKAERDILAEFRNELKAKAEIILKLPESEAKQLYDDIINEFELNLLPKIKERIELSDPTNIDIIPSHIREYAARSLGRYIDSAIDAKYNYHEDVQYVIRSRRGDGEAAIQPVDYANTGVTLKDTVWQYGLHQFLQLKHNLHLTSESLTSCFVSNLCYIRKYGDKIYGLTGTLGSAAEQGLLSSIYNVAFAGIPTYKDKRFTEVEARVVEDAAFADTVADDVATQAATGRATLVISETIRDAKQIEQVLRSDRYEHIVIKHFVDEENAAITEAQVNPGEVIIATNIAGRGTDFNTSARLEASGGLHVCVAFLPCNKRVEDQAFGRTARKGNAGTARLIVKRSNLDKLPTLPVADSVADCYDIGRIKAARDLLEAHRIEHIRQVKIRELTFQDELFQLFCDLYRKLKRQDQTEGEYQYVLDDLKEFWAFWFEKYNSQDFGLADTDPYREFKKFQNKVTATIQGNITFNPYYSIQQAEHFILNDKLDEAERSLNNAIQISKNPEILHSANMKLFELAIERGQVLLDKFGNAVGDLFTFGKFTPDREYKPKARVYLMATKEGLLKELNYMEHLYNADEFTSILSASDSISEVSGTLTDNLFLKHIVSRQKALSMNLAHVDSLSKQIDEHKGGITLSCRISDHIANIKHADKAELKLQESVGACELSELAAVGADTTYALREVHDVCPQILTAARAQIIAGLSLATAGVMFAPALPITTAIGGTMISEGLVDIAMELILQNTDGKFNKAAYIKGKILSYGISLLTLGISAALQCPKILNAAKKACRWLTTTLRKCPYLRSVFHKVANYFEKLGDLFEKLHTIAQFKNMSPEKQVTFYKNLLNTKNGIQLKHLAEYSEQMIKLINCKEAGTTLIKASTRASLVALQRVVVGAAFSAGKRVARQLIMNKLVVPTMSSSMAGLKAPIKNAVNTSVRDHIDKDKLKYSSWQEVQDTMRQIKESINGEIVGEILKETLLSITKYCSDWRLQISALIIDQFISWHEVCNYARYLCVQINRKLKCSQSTLNQDIDELIKRLVELLSEEIYSLVVSTTLKSVEDIFCVTKSAYKNYKDEKIFTKKCIEKNKAFKDGGPAGQEQAFALSDETQRPVIICEENGNEVTIGKHQPGEPLVYSYFAPDENNPSGHYVPQGEGRDWSGEGGTNNCLFDAAAAQIGTSGVLLRKKILMRIEQDPTRYMAPHLPESVLLFGGEPAYSRKSNPDDASRILKNSQGTETSTKSKAHPDGHVLKSAPVESASEESKMNNNDNQESNGSINTNPVSNNKPCSSAEDYSRATNKPKTAFKNKEERASVTDFAFKTSVAQTAFKKLDEGKKRQVFHIPVSDLPAEYKDLKAYSVENGKIKECESASGVAYIVEHLPGKENDPNADPLVVTAYPCAPNCRSCNKGKR